MPHTALHSQPILKKYRHSRYLGAFAVYPKTRFESQDEEEHIVLLLRAHPITFIPWIVSAVLALFFPIIMNFILPSFLSVAQIFFLNVFWYSGLTTFVFLKIILWLFNVGIVTDQRVLDIDYFNIIQKKINATTLEEVSDVGSNINGFIRSLFNYGDVHVQTAGPTQDIDFQAVPEPADVVSF
jgi:predicted membrane protein